MPRGDGSKRKGPSNQYATRGDIWGGMPFNLPFIQGRYGPLQYIPDPNQRAAQYLPWQNRIYYNPYSPNVAGMLTHENIHALSQHRPGEFGAVSARGTTPNLANPYMQQRFVEGTRMNWLAALLTGQSASWGRGQEAVAYGNLPKETYKTTGTLGTRWDPSVRKQWAGQPPPPSGQVTTRGEAALRRITVNQAQQASLPRPPAMKYTTFRTRRTRAR